MTTTPRPRHTYHLPDEQARATSHAARAAFFAACHTYLVPDDEARATSHAARVAFFASQIARAGPGSGYEETILGQAMCHGCGLNTGVWCTPCQEAGRVFYTYGGQPVQGSPLCSFCERAAEAGGRQCRVCTGEVLAPLRRVNLPPILDLHLQSN